MQPPKMKIDFNWDLTQSKWHTLGLHKTAYFSPDVLYRKTQSQTQMKNPFFKSGSSSEVGASENDQEAAKYRDIHMYLTSQVYSFPFYWNLDFIKDNSVHFGQVRQPNRCRLHLAKESHLRDECERTPAVPNCSSQLFQPRTIPPDCAALRFHRFILHIEASERPRRSDVAAYSCRKRACENDDGDSFRRWRNPITASNSPAFCRTVFPVL